MSRRLKMTEQEAIIGLLRKGWSYRKIARSVGIDRGTVSRYARMFKEASNAAISNIGADTRNGCISTGDLPPECARDKWDKICFNLK